MKCPDIVRCVALYPEHLIWLEINLLFSWIEGLGGGGDGEEKRSVKERRTGGQPMGVNLLRRGGGGYMELT